MTDMTRPFPVIPTVIATVVVVAIEFFVPEGAFGSLLFTLSFWVGIIQGSIALMAAADLCEADWHKPVRENLFSLYPLILVNAVLFLAMGRQVGQYPWVEIVHHGKWLNPTFFIVRGTLVLLISFFAARFYVCSARENSSRHMPAAVIYVIVYVATLSFVAYDWVMPLEYPWISTIFSPIFFVEGLYAAACLIALLLFLKKPADEKVADELRLTTLKDAGIIILGLSLGWAYFNYAQFLTIWYGNLPEEVLALERRVAHHPARGVAILLVFLLWVIPFISMIFKGAKRDYKFMLAIAVIVLVGMVIERLLFIEPILHFNGYLATIEFLIYCYLVAKSLSRSDICLGTETQ